MHRKKITAIRTDTIEQWTFRRPIGLWENTDCDMCGGPSEWLTLACASQSTGLSTAAVCALAESGGFHAIQTCEGHLLVCKTSLASNTKLQEGEKQ